MNADELKQEAIKYAVDYPTSYGKGYKHKDLRIAYLAGAEPREKRIAELERKLKVETELSNRLGLAYREYEQLTKEQDEHLAELEAQIKILQKKNEEYKDTLKNVRLALIQERTANIMNYGKGGVEMFDNMFEILKGVSN